MEGAWNGEGTSLTEVLASSALNAALWKKRGEGRTFLFCGIYTVIAQHENSN